MAYPIKSNPDGCVCQDVRGNRTCVECYYSHCENGTWHGSQDCWDSQCIVLDVNRLSDAQKEQFGLL